MHNRDEGIEEYLEAMYRLREKNAAIRVSHLARMLHVAPPSASEMVRKLQKLSLVSHNNYGEILLTKKGERIGRKITRKHRLVERFLSFLGMKRGLHKEACKLEHALSDQVERKIMRVVDGHEASSLASMDRGMRAKIVSINSDAASAKRLYELGLTKGTTVVLSSKAPFHGPVEILVRGTRLALGRKLALRIRARLVK